MSIAETENAVIGIQQNAVLTMIGNQQHCDVRAGLVMALNEFAQVVVVHDIDIVDQNFVRIRCQFGNALAQPPAVVQEFLLLRATDVPVIASREFRAGGHHLLPHEARIHHHLPHARQCTKFGDRQFQQGHSAERQERLWTLQCRRTHTPTFTRRQNKTANFRHYWTTFDNL